MTFLRTLFFLLLTANVLFLIMGRGMFGGVAGGEPGRLSAQIDPAKIRIVASADAARPVTPDAQPESSPAQSKIDVPASPAQQQSAAAAPAAAEAVSPAAAANGGAERCTAVAGLTSEQIAALKSKLQNDDSVKMQDRALDGSSWWVNIPPQADRDAAVRRAEEVRGQGVGGAFVIREEGEHRNAVSLGLFKSDVSEQEFMRQLQAKGVKGARITVRSVPGTRHVLSMRGPADRVGELVELALAANSGAKREECQAR